MVQIAKEFEFEAAHQLESHDGQCANIHGHSYRLRVTLKGSPREQEDAKEGFVIDFKELKQRVKDAFLDEWDHAFLAKGTEAILPQMKSQGLKIVELGFRATAENMCQHIAWLLYKQGLPVDSVRLYETRTSYAQVAMEDLLRQGGPSCYNRPKPVCLDEKLPVSEIFGPTIQGEGMAIGQKSLFLRMYGCDDHCSWCDSTYAWDGQEAPKHWSVEQIVQKIQDLGQPCGCRYITLTGGNPCIHEGAAMNSLITVLKKYGYHIGVETQGTRNPGWLREVDAVTISPKPPSSGNPTSAAAVLPLVRRLQQHRIPFSFKVVLFTEEDFDYMNQLYRQFPGPEYPWYVQPGNSNSKDTFELAQAVSRYEEICQRILQDPELSWVKPLPQLHTWLWGNERGV